MKLLYLIKTKRENMILQKNVTNEEIPFFGIYLKSRAIERFSNIPPKNTKSHLLPFPDVFKKLGALGLNKRVGWQLLRQLQTENQLKIVFGKGVVVNEKN